MTRTQSFILTDAAHDLWVDAFTLGPEAMSLPSTQGWMIRKRTLRGGRRAGIDLVELDNGALSVSILPTRGMGLWQGRFHGWPLGWQAPIVGPVHPEYVQLADLGGLGWLGGFDELLCRCGLSSNGPPGEDVHVDRSGKQQREVLNLHGRIANRPAHFVEIRIGLDPPHELTVVGQVEEGGLFFPRLNLTSRVTTVPGSNKLVIHDTVENRGSSPAEMQMLYHFNVGAPLLEAGSRFMAPLREMAPRDGRAAEGIKTWDTYSGPTVGYAEQVFYFDLVADSLGHCVAVLQNRAGNRAIALRANQPELPCFSLWKNTAALEDGYVTGLEFATNYPNFKSLERKQGRVCVLAPGGRWEATWSIEAFDQAPQVCALQGEVARLQAQAPATVHTQPQDRFGPV